MLLWECWYVETSRTGQGIEVARCSKLLVCKVSTALARLKMPRDLRLHAFLRQVLQ